MVRTNKILLMAALLTTCNVMADQDPTAPLGWKKVEEKATVQKKAKTKYYRVPKLNSIVCKPQVPCVAILNNKIVEQNDTVNGYKVAKIDSEQVTLKRGGRHWKLELFKLDIKQQ